MSQSVEAGPCEVCDQGGRLELSSKQAQHTHQTAALPYSASASAVPHNGSHAASTLHIPAMVPHVRPCPHLSAVSHTWGPVRPRCTSHTVPTLPHTEPYLGSMASTSVMSRVWPSGSPSAKTLSTRSSSTSSLAARAVTCGQRQEGVNTCGERACTAGVRGTAEHAVVESKGKAALTGLLPQGDCMVLGRATACCWAQRLHGAGQG